jgi:DHA1 family bicyclomycin/chloramphenicol resistance-like MFS transporter
MSVAVITAYNSHNPLIITLAFIPFIISQIIPSNILFPLCLSYMPQAKAKVSAVLQGSRLIFSALSLQLVGYFYQGTFQNIGLIIGVFIFIMIITQWVIIRKRHLIEQE